MKSKDEFKETDVKNRTCYYFADIIKAWDRDVDIDFNGILLEEKLYKEKYENTLIHDFSYQTSSGAKSLRIRYDEIDGFIKFHNGIRYLVLFDFGWFDKICDRIKYLIMVLQIVLIIISKESELIHIILYLLKKY